MANPETLLQVAPPIAIAEAPLVWALLPIVIQLLSVTGPAFNPKVKLPLVFNVKISEESPAFLNCKVPASKAFLPVVIVPSPAYIL